jgi:hypothetical protein
VEAETEQNPDPAKISDKNSFLKTALKGHVQEEYGVAQNKPDTAHISSAKCFREEM